jgi:Phosphomannose isomerase
VKERSDTLKNNVLSEKFFENNKFGDKKDRPILFMEPIFKEMLWGGNRLASDFLYRIPGDHTGECWGISAHENGDVKIREGQFKGKTLSEVWKKEKLIFGDRKEEKFPLLIKIIDARENLSIQVHPDDRYAMEHENGSLGKTECWYIIDCPEQAELVIGHNAKSKEELVQMIENKRWDEFIRRIPVKKGDFIQIAPGTVHAITSGCMILETQQNSDITYRVYDYDRLTDGIPRELHIQKSMDVIQVPAKPINESVHNFNHIVDNQWVEMICCEYYKVVKLNLNGTLSFEQNEDFLIMSVIQGEGKLNGEQLKKGDHLILPAEFGTVEMSGVMEIIASTVGNGYCSESIVI